MSEIGHILGTLAKAIVKIFFVGIICGIIGFVVILGVAYYEHTQAHITPVLATLDYILAAVVGVLALYAGGVTVLMGEAVRAARAAVADAAKEAGSAVHGAGNIAQSIEKEVEKHI